MKHLITVCCAVVCAMSMTLCVCAAQLDSGGCYCFRAEEFTPGETQLSGICITGLPEPAKGTVMLGDRCLRPGDVLTVDQLNSMTFIASHAEMNETASITYLPVFSNGLSGETTMTLSIRGRENKAPIAEDTAFETFKNLEITQKLRVSDPEEQSMTFAITRQPRRGNVDIHEDGSFTYTPKKNKVGVDSFTFTATDSAGKASREATVTITILKPSDSKHYADTAGHACRFAAEWMKNTGIFIGETIDGNPCFAPNRPVTRGEFMSMLVKSLDIPTDQAVSQSIDPNTPDWLKPYLAAAIRSGLISNLPAQDSFAADELITAEEAALMLCSALHLDIAPQQSVMNAEFSRQSSAVSIAAENGLDLTAGQVITRGDAAMLLYRASKMKTGDSSAMA